MKAALLAVGLVLLLAGAGLAAVGAEHRRERHLEDPVADTARGNVRIVAYGREPWTLPVELYRGATYTVYQRTFEALLVPEDVASVEFGVHLTLAPVGSVPYPFSDENLPAAESYSAAQVKDSPWIPPYSPDVVVAEATHTFTATGQAWDAELGLDTSRLPTAGAYDYVLGTWYVATLKDGTVQDMQGLAGAGKEHALVFVDDGQGRLLQAAGVWTGAVLAAAGAALAGYAMFATRR